MSQGFSSKSVNIADAGGGGGPTHATKASDETVTSSITVQDDDDLLFAMTASTNYRFEMFIIGSFGVGDFKHLLTAPTGATFDIHGTLYSYTESTGLGVSTVFPVHGNENRGAQEFNMSSGNEFVLRLTGVVSCSTTAGDLQYQWAQRSSQATATTVKAGSWIKYEEVA